MGAAEYMLLVAEKYIHKVLYAWSLSRASIKLNETNMYSK
jgi:hypothetical protein